MFVKKKQRNQSEQLKRTCGHCACLGNLFNDP
jgi:hypothetical protein